MNSLLYLIPITLALGAAALAVFLWSVRSGQYEDLDAAAWRILDDEPPPTPSQDKQPKSDPGSSVG